MKKLMAMLLMLAMVLELLPVSGKITYAAEEENKIALGNITWNQQQTEYHFPDAQADFAGGRAQRLFCLSVNEGGSFQVADGFRFQGNRRTVRGVQRNEDGTLEYISLVEDGQGEGISGKELTSITVRGMDITSTQIENFLRGLTFKRNGVSRSTIQEITVIANEMDLDDDEGLWRLTEWFIITNMLSLLMKQNRSRSGQLGMMPIMRQSRPVLQE